MLEFWIKQLLAVLRHLSGEKSSLPGRCQLASTLGKCIIIVICSVVVTYCVNLPKLELHFPEPPTLSGSLFGLVLREVSIRFGRWK